MPPLPTIADGDSVAPVDVVGSMVSKLILERRLSRAVSLDRQRSIRANRLSSAGASREIPEIPASEVPAVAALESLPVHHAHYKSIVRGEPNTVDFRMLCAHQECSTVISYWHSVPLHEDGGILNMVCEIPKETTAKMEVCTSELHNPIKQDIKKGKLRHYPYEIHWNYGMFPQTWENPDTSNEELGGICGDNDPLDVVEIGSAQMTCGHVYGVKPLGVFAMIDEGELDWKVIAIRAEDPLAASLNDIDDVERLMPGELDRVREWFTNYKIPDGKPPNVFGFEGRPQNREFALSVITETHDFYEEMEKLVGV